MNPIQLHVELEVDPARQDALVETFHKVFEPVIGRQPGFVSVSLLKSAARYLLVISFETEEQRVAWVGTEDHQRVWPQMEANLKGAKFSTMLWQTL
ncbi:MAG TPA: antibiotic biosynthesis monooxygenase [Bryobacteraceae bacterium]|nr:antibiotic biosynthesis monooxygenase [Bryobacteraceae bacterium]